MALKLQHDEPGAQTPEVVAVVALPLLLWVSKKSCGSVAKLDTVVKVKILAAADANPDACLTPCLTPKLLKTQDLGPLMHF